MALVEWGRLTWPEAEQAVAEMPACIVPLGAIEAHGPHMELSVDNNIATEKCRRVCEQTDVILMPTIPLGVVYSLYGFPGSLSIRFDTMKQLLCDLTQSLRERGFRIVIFHSHHGGNWSVAKQAARECSMKYPDMIVASMNELSALRKAQEQYCTSPHDDPSRAHADELETSQALECCPQNVRMGRAISSYLEFPEDYSAVPYRWSDFSADGMNGDASAATKEKGTAFLQAEVEAMVQKVRVLLQNHLNVPMIKEIR